MVHRDVKPENVLVGDDGSVKVADFGLARLTDGGTSTRTQGVLMGTVAYVPPELVTTGSADPRSDVYAAGIVLYEMLTGTVPFQGESALSVAWQHVHADVPPPSEVIGGLPEALDELTLHATRREPGARPTDAGAFLAELIDVRADLALPHVPPPPRAPSPPKTQPTIAVPRGDLFPTGTEVARGSASVAPPEFARSLEGPPPERPARRPLRRGPLAFALVLVLGLLVGGAGWYLAAGQYTQAPPVLGKTRAEAVAILTKAGLKARTGPDQFSETVPAGAVKAQDPAPNGRVRRDGTVTLTLSKGPERHLVPAVLGIREAAAVQALEKETLRPEVVARWHDTVDKGLVVSTDPKAGESVRRDTVVRLVVSKGPPPVRLPDVRGKPRTEVVRTLEGLGLKVTVDERYDDAVGEGLVISQQPGAGRVLKGSKVALVVSLGRPFVALPDVDGKPFEEAKAQLEALNLVVRRGVDIPGGDNRVLSQNPGAGSRVREGSTVVLHTF
jgi:serine/threonine-protein kinase